MKTIFSAFVPFMAGSLLFAVFTVVPNASAGVVQAAGSKNATASPSNGAAPPTTVSSAKRAPVDADKPQSKGDVSPVFQVSSDPRDRIQLSVSNGIVTLQGSVGSQELADNLVKKYGRMPGVRQVRNHLGVRQSRDADAAVKVREALSHDSVTHVGAIAVTVCDGIAFLSGEVSSQEESDHAAELARGVPGVTRVSNGLRTAAQSRYPVRMTTGIRSQTRGH